MKPLDKFVYDTVVKLTKLLQDIEDSRQYDRKLPDALLNEAKRSQQIRVIGHPHIAVLQERIDEVLRSNKPKCPMCKGLPLKLRVPRPIPVEPWESYIESVSLITDVVNAECPKCSPFRSLKITTIDDASIAPTIVAAINEKRLTASLIESGCIRTTVIINGDSYTVESALEVRVEQ